MDRRYVILRDCDHPLMEGDAASVLGDHDDPGEDAHCHYSILAVEDSLVVNVDWGYHTEDEAREVAAHADLWPKGENTELEVVHTLPEGKVRHNRGFVGCPYCTPDRWNDAVDGLTRGLESRRS